MEFERERHIIISCISPYSTVYFENSSSSISKDNTFSSSYSSSSDKTAIIQSSLNNLQMNEDDKHLYLFLKFKSKEIDTCVDEDFYCLNELTRA